MNAAKSSTDGTAGCEQPPAMCLHRLPSLIRQDRGSDRSRLSSRGLVFSVLEKPAFLILLILLILLLVVGMIVAIVIVASRSRSRSGVVAPQPGSVPPGWYPQAGGGQAYWNGAAWTGDATAPYWIDCFRLMAPELTFSLAP
jgi:hypothetical protein